VVVVSDREDGILFVPFDESSPVEALPQFLQTRFTDLISRDLEFSCQSFQTIFLTSEKHQSQIIRKLDTIEGETHLLVLDADKIAFIRGKFENQRLDYRFEQKKTDPELIPRIFNPDLGEANKGLNRTIFYQQLFHVLNKSWLEGNRRRNLRKVIRDSVPYWHLVGKNDRKTLTSQVERDLKIVFEQSGFELPRLSVEQKKKNSQPETVIILPDPPETKKEISDWLKAQRLALRSLGDDAEQITIDLLKLTLSP